MTIMLILAHTYHNTFEVLSWVCVYTHNMVCCIPEANSVGCISDTVADDTCFQHNSCLLQGLVTRNLKSRLPLFSLIDDVHVNLILGS